jgi:hypothetical protein
MGDAGEAMVEHNKVLIFNIHSFATTHLCQSSSLKKLDNIMNHSSKTFV